MQSTDAIQKKITQTKATWEVFADNRPTDYIYALLSNHVYQDLQEEDKLPEDEDWEVVSTKSGTSGYFGALYYNRKDNHYVLSHRGTANLAGWIEDFKGIYLSNISPQKHEAFVFVKEAVDRAKQSKAGLSFTGHSLGAFLAELSVFYCHNDFDYPHVNAVTFESPGTKERLEEMMSQIPAEELYLTELDIVGYLSYANLINTCNSRLGTNYQLDPDLGKLGWVNGIFIARAHSMDGLVATFDGKDRAPRAIYLKDWPKGNQKTVFFKKAEFKDGRYQTLSTEDVSRLFELTYKAHYSFDKDLSTKNVLPLRNFDPSFQVFLLVFHEWRGNNKQQGEEALESIMKDVPSDIQKYLLSYELIKRPYRPDSSRIVRIGVNEDITDFRKKVSNWLNRSRNRDVITALMSKTTETSSLTLISRILAPGAKAGSLNNVRAVSGIMIPEDTSPENVVYAKDLFAQLQQSGVTVISQILGEGAEVTGTISNATAFSGVMVEQRKTNTTAPHSPSLEAIASSSTPYFDEKRRQLKTNEIDETTDKTQKMTVGGTSEGK
jgi:hypothetical protein